MEQDFLEVETQYAMTESGLILPHKTGRAALILGAKVPQEELVNYAKQLEFDLEENQGGVYVSLDFFTLSALKVAREQGWTPPH